MRENKLRIQVMQAAKRLSRAARVEPCHWSEGCNNNVGVTAGKASLNASNARGVTAGKRGRNSNTIQLNTISGFFNIEQKQHYNNNCYP